MERHAVPQNIMEVEFKLFGSLTVKQFAFMAAGFLIALGIYYMPIIDIMKYPFIAISSIGGLVLSIGQINGQPSTTWLSNFIAALFTSQERVWKKTAVTPEIFTDKPIQDLSQDRNDEVLKKKGGAIIMMKDAPLLAFADETDTKYDVDVDDRLKSIDDHLNFIYNELPQKYGHELPVNEISKVEQFEQIKQTDNNLVQVTGRTAKETVLTNSSVNIIEGIIFGKDQQIIADAIIYIKSPQDQILRKLFTDRNGEFASTTPLPNGEYYVDIESKKCKFPKFKVILNGKVSPKYKFIGL